MLISNRIMKILFFYLLLIQSIINGETSLPNVCLITFDNATNLSNTNSSQYLCPSLCYTMKYKTNHNQYPIYGNETYSGNSLICKSAMHDGRVSPWLGENNSIVIQKNSNQLSRFESVLRNGILSSKSTNGLLNSYSFLNNRINESSILDIAIEHRGYLYSDDERSSITCRSKDDLFSIEPIQIDQGWKFWIENPLKYFTYPLDMTREQALSFCMNNNGTFFFWNTSIEQDLIQNEIFETISKLFRYQINERGNDTLTFYVGLKRINSIKQWESNIIKYNSSSFDINVDSINNEDYCTLIQMSATNVRSLIIKSHRCDDNSIRGYPLCRLIPSLQNEENSFIYRIETDNQPGNLTGVIEYCYELGGYPIYANNAYEWHLIQEIMLKDKDFNVDYVYTGLISPRKDPSTSYWLPRNISYNNSLNYLRFGGSRGIDRIGYHLSKSRDQSYYILYDINPYTTLNNLRFCRKDSLKPLMKKSGSCVSKECRTSGCLNESLPGDNDHLTFGLYGCFPKNSLASIVYTHSFPRYGDFNRSDLPMENSVAIRRNRNLFTRLNLVQFDKDLRLDCYEYVNMDVKGMLNDTLQLNCISSDTNNKTISGIRMEKSFNSLLSIGLKDRRISSHHLRFIDYDDSGSRCGYRGISHPYINQCICSPGFYGNECQYSCPSGYYGQNCDYQCQGDDPYCKGLLICLADPYGCSCYSGWYGTNCDRMCPSNRYGPDCSYECGCESCNRFTGQCGCEGTECYEGLYNRREIESRCVSSSRSNLALLISVPIVSVIVLIGILGGLLYWRKKQSADEENLFNNSNNRFRSDSYRSSLSQKDFNNILSERL